jgi:glutamate formiminotransferase
MNLTDYRRTALHTVFNLVRSEAEAYGVQITDSEVVGLIPFDALVGAARHYLRLRHFDPDQILELKLLE